MILLRNPIPGASRAALQQYLARVQRELKLPGELTVLVTGDDEIREMNRKFREKDKPTDVLSFPSEAANYAGDIAISADIARAQARAMGHSLADELRILMLHGALHLAGYDHEKDNGRMERRERDLRRKLRLPGSLIERTTRTAAKTTSTYRRKPKAAAGRAKSAQARPGAAGRKR